MWFGEWFDDTIMWFSNWLSGIVQRLKVVAAILAPLGVLFRCLVNIVDAEHH